MSKKDMSMGQKEEQKKIKILQVLPSLNVCGGVENYLMNYYTHISLDRISFDFVVHDVSDVKFRNIIDERGGNVFVLPKFSLKNYSAIKKEISYILKNNNYEAIHCHQANAAFLYLKIAKLQGIKCRILHSHQAAAADKFTHKIRNIPLLFLGKRYATDFFACSKLAGDYLYKKKNYTIINNAVDLKKFAYSDSFRAEVRDRYNISDNAFVIGNVGRMCPQKNQSFLLDIFQSIYKSNNNAYLLLVGDGELRPQLEKKAKDYGIDNRVIFTGVCTEVYKYYSAMDVFVLPSLYEGLPVVGVEAQASGLNMITSTNVTTEAKILNGTKFISLNASIDEWCSAITSAIAVEREKCVGIVADSGYDISEESKKLEQLYLELSIK